MIRVSRMLAGSAAVLLGAIAALTAPSVLTTDSQAEAASTDWCSNTAIEQAIYGATGEHTGQVSGAGLACNPYLYNKGRWSTSSELQSHVNEVLNRCGNSVQGRLLVLALLEVTGIAPQAGVGGFDNVCHQSVYDRWWNDTRTYSSPGVNWNEYVGNAYPSLDVYSAVDGVMSTCFSKTVSHAVVSVIDRYPVTNPAGLDPTLLVNSGLGARGQCDSALYRNGVWASYEDLKQRVIDRAYRFQSNAPCTDSNVQAAFEHVTGWWPLASECDTSRYGNGNYGDLQALVNRVYHSLRCSEPWLGQFLAFDLPPAQRHRARGRGWAVGECNTLLYRKYDRLFLGYADFRDRVVATHGVLAGEGVEIRSDGDVRKGGIEYDAHHVLVGSSQGAPEVGDLAGTVFRPDRGGSLLLLKPNQTSPVISTGGGNVISTGGGNIIPSNGAGILSDNGGGLIGQAGGN